MFFLGPRWMLDTENICKLLACPVLRVLVVELASGLGVKINNKLRNLKMVDTRSQQQLPGSLPNLRRNANTNLYHNLHMSQVKRVKFELSNYL